MNMKLLDRLRQRALPWLRAWTQGLVTPGVAGYSHYLFLAAASLAMAFFLYSPILAPGKALVGANTDHSTLNFPNRDYINDCLRHGIPPLWNPYVAGGMPVQTGLRAAFTPGAVLALFFDTATEIKVNLILHAALACFGMAGLLLSYRLSPMAALVGGMVVGFGGAFLPRTFAGHMDIATAFGWVPLTLWLVCLAMRRSGLAWTMLAAVGMALQICNGHYQTTYIMGWTCGLLTLLVVLLGSAEPLPRLSLFRPFARESQPRRSDDLLFFRLGWRERVDDLLGWLYRWTLIGLLAALLTLFQWWAHLESMGHTNRGANDISFLLEFNPRPLSFLTFLVPTVFDYSNSPSSFCDWLPWEGQFYQGVVALVFALFALVALPKEKTLPQFLVLVLCLFLMLGDATPIFRLYHQIDPGVRLFRVPARFILSFSMMMAWLTALGVDYAAQRWTGEESDGPRSGRTRRRLGWVLLLLGGCYALPWLFFYYGSPGSTWWHQFLLFTSGESTYRLFRAWQTQESYVILFALTWMRISWELALVGGVGYVFWRAPRAWILPLLVVISLSDFLAYTRPSLVCIDTASLILDPNIVKFFGNRLYTQRLSIDGKLHQVNRAAAFHLSDMGCYDAFSSAVFQRAILTAYCQKPETTITIYEQFSLNRLTDLQGVRFFFSEDDFEALVKRDPNMRNLRQAGTLGDGVYVYEALRASPRAYLVHEVRRPVRAAALFNEMIDDLNVPERYVFLDPATYREFCAQESLTPGGTRLDSVNVVALEPNRVDIDVSSPAGGLVVLTDICWPGWWAAVDGQPSKIYPVHEGLHRGVVVGPGRHRVTFLYHPSRFYNGLKISGLVLLIIVSYSLAGGVMLFLEAAPEGKAVA